MLRETTADLPVFCSQFVLLSSCSMRILLYELVLYETLLYFILVCAIPSFPPRRGGDPLQEEGKWRTRTTHVRVWARKEAAPPTRRTRVTSRGTQRRAARRYTTTQTKRSCSPGHQPRLQDPAGRKGQEGPQNDKGSSSQG